MFFINYLISSYLLRFLSLLFVAFFCSYLSRFFVAFVCCVFLSLCLARFCSFCLLRFYYRFVWRVFCSFCLARLFVAFVWRVYLLSLFGARRVSAESFLRYRFLYISFVRYIDFSIYRWIGIKNRAKLIFLVFSAGLNPAFPSSYSAGLSGSFFFVFSAGCHPAFTYSRSTLSCAREFREWVAIAFAPPCPVCATSAGAFLPVSIPLDAIRLLLLGCSAGLSGSFFLRVPPDYPALFFLGSSAGLNPAFSSSCSAGCHPAFTYSRSTLSCAREFRERVAIAFFPALSCVRYLRWLVFYCYLRWCT